MELRRLAVVVSVCLVAMLIVGGAGPLDAGVISPPTAGLAAWHRADQGVSTIAGKVDSWADQSGNGNDLTLVPGDPNPTYQGWRPTVNVGGGADGKDLIHFSGGQFLDTHLGSDIRTASDLGMLNSDYEMYVVIQSQVSQVAFPISGNAAEQYEIHTNGPGGARFIPTNGKFLDVGSTGQYLDGLAHIVGGRVSAAGVGTARADGVDGASAAGSLSTSDVYMNVGQRVSGGYRYNGDIAEVLIYDHELTPQDRASVETYLAERWDVLPLLPQDPAVPTSGLTAWLKADTAVVADAGGSVSLWGDASNNGHHANQTVPGNRPTLVPDAMADKPVIDFSGPGIEHLNIHDTVTLGMQNSDYEIFIVGRSEDPGVQFVTAGSHTAGYESYEIHLNGSVGARFIPRLAPTDDPADFADFPGLGTLTTGTPHLFNVRVDNNVGYIRVGGMESADTVANAQSSSGQWLTLGVRGDATYGFNGDMAEVLVFDRALTPAERAQVQEYLYDRWGVFHLAESGGGPVINNAATAPGATAFAKDLINDFNNDGVSDTYPNHRTDNLNDGLYGNTDSWIAGTSTSFAGVALAGPTLIDGIAFGRDNGGEANQFSDRWQGIYTFQYTLDSFAGIDLLDAAQVEALDWHTIAALQYSDLFDIPDDQGYLRHLYEFGPISGVTGVRILTSGAGIAIDELEVSAIPEPATLVLVAGGVLALIRRRFARR